MSNQNYALYLRYLMVFLASLMLMQLFYSVGQHQAQLHKQQHFLDQLKIRVSLDLDKLQLAQPNSRTTGKPELVNHYVELLNQQMTERQWPLQLVAINSGLRPNSEQAIAYPLPIEGESTIIWVKFQPVSLTEHLSIYPWLAALLSLLLLRGVILKSHRAVRSELVESQQKAWVMINLSERVLVNTVTANTVALSNKPLCFYCALLDYSIKNPQSHLNPNKDLPEELIETANKYFYRLIELGHTIRKRPNFNNNLEKVLSEIRAALDELFGDDYKRKVLFYPPKAIGEGSRSKSHNIILTQLGTVDIEVVGK